ncbi:hypothetical protein GGF32_001409 [Allomyces javanicus]|nr:hypothetical protein GGF32_001409 [Allomyces javanicus]
MLLLPQYERIDAAALSYPNTNPAYKNMYQVVSARLVLKAAALANWSMTQQQLDQLNAHLRELDLTPQRIQPLHVSNFRPGWLDAAMQNPAASSSSAPMTAVQRAYSSVPAATTKESAQVTAPSSSKPSPGELSLGELLEERYGRTERSPPDISLVEFDHANMCSALAPMEDP